MHDVPRLDKNASGRLPNACKWLRTVEEQCFPREGTQKLRVESFSFLWSSLFLYDPVMKMYVTKDPNHGFNDTWRCKASLESMRLFLILRFFVTMVFSSVDKEDYCYNVIYTRAVQWGVSSRVAYVALGIGYMVLFFHQSSRKRLRSAISLSRLIQIWWFKMHWHQNSVLYSCDFLEGNQKAGRQCQ